jgi:hypothetical protein
MVRETRFTGFGDAGRSGFGTRTPNLSFESESDSGSEDPIPYFLVSDDEPLPPIFEETRRDSFFASTGFKAGVAATFAAAAVGAVLSVTDPIALVANLKASLTGAFSHPSPPRNPATIGIANSWPDAWSAPTRNEIAAVFKAPRQGPPEIHQADVHPIDSGQQLEASQPEARRPLEERLPDMRQPAAERQSEVSQPVQQVEERQPQVRQPMAGRQPEAGQQIEQRRPEVRQQMAARQPEEPKPEAVATPVRRMDPDELAALIKRAEGLIAIGDIPPARLLLKRAADAQAPRAALLLARTYDPAVLGTPDMRSIQPDPAAARHWYQKAAELGSLDAQKRLAEIKN